MPWFNKLHYAFRQLRRSPSVTLVAVISLALGIGANTSLFELANRVLFHPLDVLQPERLVSVVDGDAASQRWSENSFREYTMYRDNTSAFSGVAASSETSAGLSAGEIARPVTISSVTRNFFDVLGVHPSLGAAFTGADVPMGSDDGQLVIGHSLWVSAFAADPKVVGRVVRLNGTPFTVIGVSPEGFNGISLGTIDAWVPIQAVRLLAVGFNVGSQLSLTEDNMRWLRVTARMKPGITTEAAAANIVAVRNTIAYPKDQLGPDGRMPTALVSTVSTVSVLGNDAGKFVMLLGGVVAFTLLIACANLATLLLATGTARAREFAVRTALGAGRARLIGQLVAESTLLALIGGGAGLLVASWTGELLKSFGSAPGLPLTAVVRDPGLGSVLIALALALVTSVLIGLTPALVVTARDPSATLGLRYRGETRGHSRARSLLLGTQIALALVLLSGAGLFARSLRNALALDLGFKPEGLSVVGFNLGQQRYDSARAASFYTDLVSRLQATPGIERSTLARVIPVRAAGSRSSAWADGPTGPHNVGEHSFNVVDPSYFATLEIPIVRGRPFETADNARAPGVVIVNEAMAKLAWPGEDAVGKRFWFGSPTDGPALTVVGVAKNSTYRSLRENGLPYYFLPLAQNFSFSGLSTMRVAFRSPLPPERAIAAVHAVIRSIDPELPLIQAQTVQQQMAVLLTTQQMGAAILGTLSGLGLILALFGLYGVVSYSVARRTHELGIRIALGAGAANVVRLTLSEGMRPVLVGAGIGIVLVIALARAATNFLYGVNARDPLTLAGATLVLLGVAAASMLVPARRATRIEPTQALREE